jgi:hypothetical protein
MTDNKKDSGEMENKERNVEKLTNEKLDEVSGGKIGCKPLICLPFTVTGAEKDKGCKPGLCNPLCAPNT